jgi:hypothetical protein
MMMRWGICSVMLGSLPFLLAGNVGLAIAQPADDYSATTEHSCSFGMAQGEPGQRCEVPFPRGCVVVNFPGTTKPWISVSKAGRTFCRFDTKASDWKTKITGACNRCESIRCSAQFIVRFDCSKG